MKDENPMSKLAWQKLAIVMVCAVAASASAADVAKLTADRQKQLKDLFSRRADFMVQARIQQANIVAGQQQLRSMESEYNSLQRELASIRDRREDEEDKKARSDNEENDRRRSEIRSRLSTLNRQGTSLRVRVQAAVSSLQLSSYKLETEWVGLADRFGRLSQAEHQASLSVLDQWIAADADDAGAHMARALAQSHLGQPAMALTDLQRVIALTRTGQAPGGTVDPVLISAYCVRAWLLSAEGKDRESAKEFGAALAIKGAKNHIDCCLFQGMAYCSQGKLSLAEGKFKQAASLYPNDPEGHRLLGLLLATCNIESLRNGKKAVASAQKASDLTKGSDWACLYALAAAHAEAGSFDKASQLAADAANLTIDEHRAACLSAQQEYDQQRPLRLEWK